MCVQLHAYHTHADALGSQRGLSSPLKLDLQAVVSCQNMSPRDKTQVISLDSKRLSQPSHLAVPILHFY